MEDRLDQKKKKETISQSSSLAIGLLNLWQPSLLLTSKANLQIPQWGIACTSLQAPACGSSLIASFAPAACEMIKESWWEKLEWKYLHWHYSFAEGKYQNVCGGEQFVQLRRQGEVALSCVLCPDSAEIWVTLSCRTGLWSRIQVWQCALVYLHSSGTTDVLKHLRISNNKTSTKA